MPDDDGAAWVLGLDPTAGLWEHRMTRGVKPMSSVMLEVIGERIRMPDHAHQTHLTNDSFEQLAADLQPGVIAIDGPCGVCGCRLRADHSGWEIDAQTETRPAERALAARGIGLFWTTANTLQHFDGASRWIARSLRLFESTRAFRSIETHPHGAFFTWHRQLALHEKLPNKNTPAGRAVRLELLQARVENLDDRQLPNHDAVDAACAAVVAAYHHQQRTEPLGDAEQGGLIWLPR